MPKSKYYFDGRYYQQKVRKSDNPADGYITVRGKTVSELERKLSDLNFKRHQGLVLGSKTTVAEWIAIWWRNREYSFSASVISYRRPMINNVIAPALGNLRVDAVRPEHIQQLFASVSDRSKSYNQKLRVLLNLIFRDAKANGLTIINPVENIKAGGKDSEEKPALSADQFQTLLSAVSGTRAELFVALGYYTGLRKEELCGLQWSEVHLSAPAPYIEVNHAVTWPDRSQPVYPSPLKTTNSQRLIPIHTDLLPILSAASEKAPGSFVISNKDGGPVSFMSLRRLWGIVDDRTLPEFLPKSRVRNYRSDANGDGSKKKPNRPKTIDFYVTPHILRHSFATNLVSSGMDIKKVQYLTGHADVTVLLKIYSHVKQNTPAELASFINAAM